MHTWQFVSAHSVVTFQIDLWKISILFYVLRDQNSEDFTAFCYLQLNKFVVPAKELCPHGFLSSIILPLFFLFLNDSTVGTLYVYAKIISLSRLRDCIELIFSLSRLRECTELIFLEFRFLLTPKKKKKRKSKANR